MKELGLLVQTRIHQAKRKKRNLERFPNEHIQVDMTKIGAVRMVGDICLLLLMPMIK